MRPFGPETEFILPPITEEEAAQQATVFVPSPVD